MRKGEKGLSAGHLTMMALGTVIGGSFFLGSSVAIRTAGPAILGVFIFCGMLVYFILSALSEMTVANPGVGSFRTFAAQAFGPGAGFVVGWVYWTGIVLSMSSEATAVSLLIRQWVPNLSIPIFGSCLIFIVTMLNLLGAEKLSKLESSLSGVKVLAILSFIAIALYLLFSRRVGTQAAFWRTEPLMPSGWGGIFGSLMLVMLSYSGFEIIGLAACETENPRVTVPKAINRTIFILISLYIVCTGLILPLIPTAEIQENTSPLVAALDRRGMGWAGSVMNFVLITAIFSTMLASMFGLGRMMRSLAAEDMAPNFLKDNREVPYRGILFSGAAMLLGLWFGLLLPKVYLFLISAGGTATIFTYISIMATHIAFRKQNGAPAEGEFRLRGFPYSSLFALISLAAGLVGMPFVDGQGPGLLAGVLIILFYMGSYALLNQYRQRKAALLRQPLRHKTIVQPYSAEVGEELHTKGKDEQINSDKE